MAIWAVRRMDCNAGSIFNSRTSRIASHWQELEDVAPKLRLANQFLIADRGFGLRIAAPGHLGLTLDERHILRGTAAAQADAEDAVAVELAALVPEGRARPTLTTAIGLLGAALAACGYWLPKPYDRSATLPCAALHLVRLQGTELRHVQVMWPCRS